MILFTGAPGIMIHSFMILIITHHGITLTGHIHGTGDGATTGTAHTIAGDWVIRLITVIGTGHIMEDITAGAIPITDGTDMVEDITQILKITDMVAEMKEIPMHIMVVTEEDGYQLQQSAALQ